MFFMDEVIKRNRKKDAKLWHKSVQRFCGYASKNQLLDKVRGPVADPNDFMEAMEG